MLLRVLRIDRSGRALRPAIVDERGADAETQASADRVGHRKHEQVRFVRMHRLARGDRVQARRQRPQQSGEFGGRETRARRVGEHVEDVVAVVPRREVVPELFLIAFFEERPEILRALGQTRVEEPLADHGEIELRRERFAEREMFIAPGRDRFFAGRAQPLQDCIDERLHVSWPHAERVPGLESDSGSCE